MLSFVLLLPQKQLWESRKLNILLNLFVIFQLYIKVQSLLLHNLFHTLLRLKEIFPFVGDEKNHSNAYQFKDAGKQGAMQLAALAVTLVIAIVGGTITGFILKGFF